ncbi:MAG TPA: alpha/beta fold hydrolase, partial [Sphingomonas sp.]|nr:alpha/beta fold hydrolase [Sphingomonas sp.]
MLKTVLAAAFVAALFAGPARGQQVIRLPAEGAVPGLLVRHLPGSGAPVLYVHGATFPSALSIGWKIDGRSWMDDLHERGFDVWAFDFAGYGGSDRPAALQGSAPYGGAEAAAVQIERVARHVLAVRGAKRLSVIAHSWGTIPAGMFAGARPDLVERLVLFGPIAERSAGGGSAPARGTRLVSRDDQWRSFQAGVPPEHGSPIARAEFDSWVTAYLTTDPTGASRNPASVAVPSGPDADFAQAWSGRFPYDPAVVRAPTLIVRGAWDPIAGDSDVAWLAGRLTGVPGGARVVTLAGGAHRMLLEER